MKPERTQPVESHPYRTGSPHYLRPTIFGKQQRDGQVHTVLHWHPVELARPFFRPSWSYAFPTVFFQSPKSIKVLAWMPALPSRPSFFWNRTGTRPLVLMPWERIAGATTGKPIASVSFLLTARPPLLGVAHRNTAQWNRVLQTAAAPKGPGAKTQPADEV